MNRVFFQYLITGVCIILLLSSSVGAQPDPQQMSGIPLPVTDLSDGTISVRVVLRELSNNIPDQIVELHLGDNVITALTNQDGRAQFTDLDSEEPVFVSTTVEDQLITSRRFQIPEQGGVRLMLVATGGGGDAVDVDAQPGTVTLGDGSRFLVELGESTVEVYCLFDIVNVFDYPVTLTEPLVFEMPSSAQGGVTLLPESTVQAVADDLQVTVTGPFQSGSTIVNVAYVVPYSGPELMISQHLPIELEGVLIVTEKVGDVELESAQISRQVVMTPTEDQTYILGAGAGIPAGGMVTFELSGLPHHNSLPRMVTMVISSLIVLFGLWASVAVRDIESGARRDGLQAQRENYFKKLIQIELQYRSRHITSKDYMTKREALVLSLEQIYQKLDKELVPVVLNAQESAPTKEHVIEHSSTSG